MAKRIVLSGAGRGVTIVDGEGKGTPVRLEGIAGAVVRNLTVTGGAPPGPSFPFGQGLELEGCTGIRIEGLEATGNQHFGIWISRSNGVALTNSVVTANPENGIAVSSSHACTFAGNRITNPNGMQLFDSRGNTIEGNTQREWLLAEKMVDLVEPESCFLQFHLAPGRSDPFVRISSISREPFSRCGRTPRD